MFVITEVTEGATGPRESRESPASGTMNLLKAFIAWTISSYACHHMAKVFLTEVAILAPSWTPAARAAALSLLQLLICYLMTIVSRDREGIIEPNPKKDLPRSHVGVSYYVAMGMHVLSTFLTNWSLARMEAASTLAIKLTEPVVSAIAQWVWLRKGMNCHVWVSLPLVVGGALVFVSDHSTHVQQTLSAGVVLAMGSNIFVAIRNLAVKGLHSGQLNVNLRVSGGGRVSQTLVLWCVILLAMSTTALRYMVAPGVSLVVTSLLLSGVFHVTYSLISTSVILRALDVVSHAMANVIKRVLVVGLLYVSGSRSASAVNAVGLSVAAMGLAVYVRGKAEETAVSGKNNFRMHFKGLGRLKIVSCPTGLLMVLLTVISFASFTSMGSSWILPHLNHTFPHLREVYCQHGPQLTPDWSSRAGTFGLNWPGPPDNATLLSEWADFLSWDYTQHPFDTDRLAPSLQTNDDVIWEIQRLHVQVLTAVLEGRRNAMLMEFSTSENKGDPAITAGEVALLRRLNVTVVFYCSFYTCNDSNLQKGVEISKNYTPSSLVILLHGGGNLVGYPQSDHIRGKIFKLFPEFPWILLSQSIWLQKGHEAHLNKCMEMYSNRTNLTIFLRDRQSLGLAQKYFKGTKLMLMPDMAFGLGRVPRTMPPTHDIVWLKRGDHESSGYKIPEIPTNLSVAISDWWEWRTNKGRSPMETAFLIAFNGLSFLQRGRVVITDRLHGHILSVLLGIPHVLIDNPPYFKLSSFRRTWTAGLPNTVLVTSGEEALVKAQELLQKYDSSLPAVIPYWEANY